MKGLLHPSVLAALLVGVLAWLFLANDPPAVDCGGPARHPGASDLRAAAPRAATRPEAHGDARVEAWTARQPLQDRRNPATQGNPGPPRIAVRGRCIDDRHATPLAGVAIDVAVVPRRFGRRVEAETPVAEAPRVYSDVRGRFEVLLEVPAQHQVRIRTSIAGRATMQGYPRPGTGSSVDTGDIRIPLGARLSATVVDHRGRRQPDVAFRLLPAVEAEERQDTITPIPWLDARSDSCGRIQTGIALVAGRWTVAPREGFRLVAPLAGLVVPEGVSSLEAGIVVASPDPVTRITGWLRDECGCPLPCVTIQAQAGGPPVGEGTTDTSGRFQVERRASSDEPVHLVVPYTTGFESLTTRESYPWGSKNVALTLARAGDLKITVVAADDGSPVEDFGVVWFAGGPEGRWHRGGRLWPTHHEGGTAVLRGVPAGGVRVVVLPCGRTFAANEPVELTRAPGPGELRVALPRRLVLPVLVVDGARRPVANTRLQLVRALDDRPVPLQPQVVDHGHLGHADELESQVLLLDTAETDARGRATLRWHLTDGALAIRILGPGHVPTVHAPVFLRRDPRLVEIVVARGATLRGTVAPLDVLSIPPRASGKRRTWTQQPRVELSYLGAPRSGRPPDITAPIHEGGDFLIEGLAPGTWNVTVHIWQLGGQDGGILRQEHPSITLGAGEQRHLALDIRDLRSGQR